MRPYATKTQLRVLGMIATAIRQQGYPPALMDICKVFGWSSANAADEHIRRLRRHGLLEPVGDAAYKSRTVRPTAAGWTAAGIEQPSIATRSSVARLVAVKFGWRCAVDGCDAMTFDPSKPCPMCALRARKVA